MADFSITRVEIKPGDSLVVASERFLTAEQMACIRDVIIKATPDGVKVIFVCGGLRLSVLAQGAKGDVR